MRRWLPALAVRRPVSVAMTFLALLVLGAIAYTRIPLQMMPSGFDYPFLWVWVPNPGGTPMETESQVVLPVEEQLATISGIKELSSSASENAASFSLEFHQSVDLDAAYNAVVDRLERVMPEMPGSVRDYGVYRYNPADEPVLWVGVTLPEELEDAHSLVQDVVQKRLERIGGVGKVEVWGTDERLVFIDFDRDALFAHAVNLGDLIGRLSSDNFQMASGRLQDRGSVRYVRSLARFEDLDVLKGYPVRDGVTLADVAEISYRRARSTDIHRLDGQPGVGLAIFKESAANTVAVCAAVREALPTLTEHPQLVGSGFHTFFDQGELIEDSVNNLLMTALQGGVFAVAILFLFLRDVRLTLLIASCIPLSLLLSVTALFFTGSTLNLISLMGLMIAVGMVVDNAIVVVETIFRRRRDGADPATAAIEGTGEVNLAITLSTLTTMVVFLPLILMSEDAMFSFFMGALGFPVVYALAASLLVAVIFTPLATVWMKGSAGAALKGDPPWIRWMAARYERALRWALSHRFDAFIGLIAIVMLTAMVPMKSVGCTDQAQGNLGDFVIRFEVPASFTYPEREALVDEVEALVDEHREDWNVRVTRTRLRGTSTWGYVQVYLNDDAPPEERDAVLEEVERLLPEVPGARIWLGWDGGQGADRSNSTQIHLSGDDTETLLTLADEVLRRVRAAPGVLSAENSLERDGADELRLVVDREAAARHGISATSVGRTLAFAMRGTRLSDFHDGEREVEVWARFAYEDRQDLDTLLDFEMWSPTQQSSVPLRALVTPETGRGFDSIRRRDRKTSLGLTINLDPDLELEATGAAIEGALEDLELPRGYDWSQGRRFNEQMANDDARNKALLLSITFVFLLMGVLFESFILPMSIIATVPMAMIGVYWTLYITDTPLDVMGGVGLVVLVGVVVNNGIVLVDLVTQLRNEGYARTEALVVAGQRRLRPILMTALTTLVGLLPMATGSSTFVGIPYAPLGRVVGGGLAAATLLTLFCVPYLYSLLDDLRAGGGQVIAFATRRPGAAPPPTRLSET